MERVVALDRLDRSQDFVHRSKREETFSGRESPTESGLLGDDWPPGRQIAGAAVAEPAGIGPHVLIAGDGELATRTLDVGAIPLGVSGDVHRVDLAPAVLQEAVPRPLVDACRQL